MAFIPYTTKIDREGPKHKVYSEDINFINEDSGYRLERIVGDSTKDSIGAIQGDTKSRNKCKIKAKLKKAGGPENLLCLLPRKMGGGIFVSLESITVNGKLVTPKINALSTVDKYTDSFGGVNVYSDGVRTSVLYPTTNATKSFKIVYRINAPGYGVDGMSFYHGDDFVLKANAPILFDEKMERIVLPGGPVGNYDYKVKHSLVKQPDGSWFYTKESVEGFEKLALPPNYLIDADMVYSESGDGWVGELNANWTTCRENATGDYAHLDTQTQHAYTYDAEVGGGNYVVIRALDPFDLSALSGKLNSASMYIYGYSQNAGSVVLQGSTKTAGSIEAASYSTYSALNSGKWGEVNSWSLIAYNIFTINSLGISEIEAAFGATLWAISRHDDDYYNNTPGGNSYCGRCYSEHADINKRPHLLLDISSVGQGMIMMI